MRTYLTKTGLLIVRKYESFFTSNDGQFRRLATDREVNYLKDRLVPITYDCSAEHNSGYQSTNILNHDRTLRSLEILLWQYLWSTVCDDYSHYKPGTCNNGGDYSFHTSKHFFARCVQGKWEIRSLTTYSTSAEFPYDELTGSFQSNLYDVFILGIAGEEKWVYSSQTYSGEDEEIILDQLLDEKTYTMQEAIDASDYYIPSKEEEEDGKTEKEIEVTKEESDKRCLRLNEISYAGKRVGGINGEYKR